MKTWISESDLDCKVNDVGHHGTACQILTCLIQRLCKKLKINQKFQTMPTLTAGAALTTT